MAGSSAFGGTTNVGGTVAFGGETSANVDAGTGCTGSFEIIDNSSGLCIAKMATISGPNTEVGANDAGGFDYNIDVTEVTQGQYDDWLATAPLLPPSTDADCGYVTSYAAQGTGYTGNDADHHPVVYVDWCDATAYCQGVGKRLCGAISGGPIDNTVVQDEANQSQWYRACSSAGADTYPYGNAYVRDTCNGFDYWNDDSATTQTVPVGTIASCVTTQLGFAGVHDLSGNVWEWEDNCSTSLASCRIRGGSFANTSDAGALSCGLGTYTGNVRGWTAATVGFRCCSE
jgi:formylglycine-generating enzyme required for sulfatase activity